MLVKALTVRDIFETQITEGKIYLVLDICINLRAQPYIMYRLVGNQGIPALYYAEDFEVISDTLEKYRFVFDDELRSHLTLFPEELVPFLKKKNYSISMFWDEYFTEPSIQQKPIGCLVQQMVERLAGVENIFVPDVTPDGL